MQQNPYSSQPAYAAPSRRPGVIPLTPLALGDLLGGSFAVIRRNAAAVVGTALIVSLIEILVSVLATTLMFDTVAGLLRMEDSGVDPFLEDSTAIQVFGELSGFVALTVAGALLAGLAGVVAQGVLAVVVLRSAAGLKTSLGQAWRLTGRQVWSLIGLGLIYMVAGFVLVLLFLAVIVGLVIAALNEDGTLAGVMGILLFVLTIASVVLGVWLYVKLLLAASASAVELRSPLKAMGRSWTLTRGHWWRTFGIILLVGIIVGVVSSIITTPLSMIGGVFAPFSEDATAEAMFEESRIWMLVSVIATSLVGSLATVYTACLVALLYTDYRIRQESFDLELAAAAEAAGLSDDARFSTVQDVQAAAGTDHLVPGRPPAGPADR
ncbi:hypothetical protein [Microbacterium sp. A93]|uniref:hypothetical protein n=1 Tax=Microbacterium sp. A93 TaxID=3450716 RepID=UPI003F4323C0